MDQRSYSIRSGTSELDWQRLHGTPGRRPPVAPAPAAFHRLLLPLRGDGESSSIQATRHQCTTPPGTTSRASGSARRSAARTRRSESHRAVARAARATHTTLHAGTCLAVAGVDDVTSWNMLCSQPSPCRQLEVKARKERTQDRLEVGAAGGSAWRRGSTPVQLLVARAEDLCSCFKLASWTLPDTHAPPGPAHNHRSAARR